MSLAKIRIFIVISAPNGLHRGPLPRAGTTHPPGKLFVQSGGQSLPSITQFEWFHRFGPGETLGSHKIVLVLLENQQWPHMERVHDTVCQH